MGGIEHFGAKRFDLEIAVATFQRTGKIWPMGQYDNVYLCARATASSCQAVVQTKKNLFKDINADNFPKG